MTQESLRRLRRCLSTLLTHQPFFGSLALRLPLRPDADCHTILSDGTELRFNPAWVASQPADDITLAIAHVVLACALKHHLRRGARSYPRWQLASHLVTLPLLREAGLTAEQGGLDLSVEAAYDTLPPESDDPQPGPDPEAGAGAAGSQGPPGEVQDAPGPQSDTAGPDAGELRPSPAQARKAQAQAWDEALHQAHALAQAQGHGSAGLQEQIETLHHTQTPWAVLLRRFMLEAAPTDYTWARPNPRFIDSGLYLPALHAPAVLDLVFAIDTSGSLDPAALERMWAEIRTVAAELGPKSLTVIQCDDEVQAVATYSTTELPAQLEVQGRGGTDFRPVFAEVEKLPTPACLIYLTDLFCDAYPRPPSYPVLWAVTDDPPESYNPPFGERIDIE